MAVVQHYLLSASYLFLLNKKIKLLTTVNGSNCEEQNFSASSIDLGYAHLLQRIAVVAPLSLFHLYIEIGDDHTAPIQLHTSTGLPVVLYSSPSAATSEWQVLDVIARKIYVLPVYSSDADIIPSVMITTCKYSTPISYFNDNMYSVDTQKAGIISVYENQLIITFRTFENGLFVFSMADQGDLLIAQIIQGKIFVIFDFGALTLTTISGGVALNDGLWHEMRWIHQLDSVQLLIDGVIINTTTPSGLYRKLDFDAQIHIGGRPPDDMSTGIETSYHGCLARVMLNNVDLLGKIPRSQRKDCQMPKPQLMTITFNSYLSIPFSFLPFSIEFRILPQPTSLLFLTDGKNQSLLRISFNKDGLLLLTLYVDKTEVEQLSQSGKVVNDGTWHALSVMIWGARLHVDVDSYTVLWLEGNAVRNIAKQISYFHLSAVGCYRSATVSFRSANIFGNVTLDACHFQNRCLPDPCENHGICEQISLSDFKCSCRGSYYGKTCHATKKYRSCEEFFLKNPQIRIKNVTIDLDGGNQLAPITLQCERHVKNEGEISITTTLFHQYERSNIVVAGDHEPGSVKKSLDYGVNGDQLDRFIEGFENCEQYMRYECRGGAKLMSYGLEQRPSSWYSTRNGQHGMQWGDAPPYSRMCSCSANSSCIDNRMCNCDSGQESVDEGYNLHMQLLPVMNLYLGGTTDTSSINVSIGPLVCSHRHVFDGITFLNRDARLTGSNSLVSSVMDLKLQIRMSHPRMRIFTWESLNGQRWFQLYVAGGHIIGQVVTGNKVFEIESKVRVDDNIWHTVYWEVSVRGMVLDVDNETSVQDVHIVLPNVYNWVLGSSTQHSLSGFAGQIRNIHLCGNEIILRSLLRKQGQGVKGIEVGEKGTCKNDRCLNHGQCVEFYDSHKCNCNNTPFIGQNCEQDFGISVPKGSELSIPWQHPAHISSCFRIAVQSFSSNYSLIRAKALFADCQFNLTVNEKGRLELSIFDGFFFHHKAADVVHKFNDNELNDVKFCATNSQFTLKINDEDAVRMSGNWSFFKLFNVWNFIDKSDPYVIHCHFTGCVTRLQVGAGFPLKDPSSSRLSHKGGIKFRSCPLDEILPEQLTEQEDPVLPGIHIHTVTEHRSPSLILTPIVGVVTGCAFILLILTIICWIRNRPDGVYKTNEDVLAYCNPDRSQQPSHTNKEYLC
ncbi:unnamed protein product [Thelazia callipaeda]|uniref:Neurexin-4 n=1 Tax=Thelazia callipaeda TaxID=103827 RepID=A0A0N5CJ82_THECL|nr:unnamed protein product [Thelazia callipaeda]